ncbi:MAG: hypothetical protein RL456_3525 [Pseudomonadota bacterium]|jgi:peptidoglycan hydrolase-like protein with peptidoglycan-binding domain
MSEMSLSASVGWQGVNRAADVRVVQRLLLRRGFPVGVADGLCGERTRAAIRTFQTGFLAVPDGRVDPGGRTWRHLSGAQAAPAREGGPLTRRVAVPPRHTLNVGLTAVNNAFMTRTLGHPRQQYAVDCQPVTDARLQRNMITASVGPFRVTGLAPAVQSLAAVMNDVRALQPEVHAALTTAGMLCCRFVRGSTTSISNHSWGTAVDLKIDGVLDRYNDGLVQHGLTLIAPIFNRHGWYWGVTFPREDGMHFEGSRTLVEAWATQLR